MCGKVYVGQSKRTARSRIKEDITSSKEHVFLHKQSHENSDNYIFEWKILQIIPSLTVRLSAEAMHIEHHKDNLINGCTGKEILTFLKSNV